MNPVEADIFYTSFESKKLRGDSLPNHLLLLNIFFTQGKKLS
jgi:hypothetical protein